jgi:hypothetical protein
MSITRMSVLAALGLCLLNLCWLTHVAWGVKIDAHLTDRTVLLTVADDSGTGTISWSNPGNATASDNSYATALFPFTGGAEDFGHYLKATSFAFSIPSTETVVGVLVEFEASRDVVQTARDQRVRLVRAGTIETTDKAALAALSSTDTYYSRPQSGASTDLWSASWSYADINDSGFGCVLAFKDSAANSADVTVRVDQHSYDDLHDRRFLNCQEPAVARRRRGLKVAIEL